MMFKYLRLSKLEKMFSDQLEDTFLIDGLVESNSLNLLVAPSFTGKTYVALDICRAVLNGDNFLDKSCEYGSVLYFDNEMKPKYFLKRIKKLNFVDNEDKFIYVNSFFPDMSNENDKTLFLEKIKDFVEEENAKLIVIDSLNTSSNGLEENSNKDMREFMDFLNKISALCTVILVHHTSKYNNPKCLTREDIRGASCIFNVCDNVMVIDKDEEIRTLKFLKARNAEKLPKPISFTFNTIDDELFLLTAESKSKPEKPSKEQVLELFKDNSNKTELLKHYREMGLVFNDQWMLKLLDSIPQIDTKKGLKNSTIYFLKS